MMWKKQNMFQKILHWLLVLQDAKKMTQKELAQKCNFEVSIISDVERGTCVYNATHVNKIQSVLGVKIPRV